MALGAGSIEGLSRMLLSVRRSVTSSASGRHTKIEGPVLGWVPSLILEGSLVVGPEA